MIIIKKRPNSLEEKISETVKLKYVLSLSRLKTKNNVIKRIFQTMLLKTSNKKFIDNKLPVSSKKLLV